MIWRKNNEKYYDGEDFERWLDTMTYKDFIEKVMGLSPEVTKYADPILASAVGLGCDITSALTAYAIGMPGFAGHSERLANRSNKQEDLQWLILRLLVE
ncbi:MAG: hypothetical protein O7D34_12315 [Ignavibacteria bacterium]|nr:hypothetical protein [Ignavibacteria bacterium]